MRMALTYRLWGAVLAIVALIGLQAHALAMALPADAPADLAGTSIVLCTADGHQVVDLSTLDPDGTNKSIPAASHADLCCCSIVGGAIPEMPAISARLAWWAATYPPAASLLERTGPPAAYRSRAPPVATQA